MAGMFQCSIFWGFHAAPTLLVGGVLEASFFIWYFPSIFGTNIIQHPTQCPYYEGAFFDGRRGHIGVTVELTHPTECPWVIGSWVKGRWVAGPFTASNFAGCVFSLRWPLGSCRRVGSALPHRKVCEEILVSLCLAPLRFTDWRASVDVKASDASWRFCDGQASHRKLGIAAAR